MIKNHIFFEKVLTSEEKSLIMMVQVTNNHISGIGGDNVNGIRNMRLKVGIKQYDLAVKIGVERTAVAKWETGKAQPRTETLIKLATVLGCTVDELLREPVTVGEGEK